MTTQIGNAGMILSLGTMIFGCYKLITNILKIKQVKKLADSDLSMKRIQAYRQSDHDKKKKQVNVLIRQVTLKNAQMRKQILLQCKDILEIFMHPKNRYSSYNSVSAIPLFSQLPLEIKSTQIKNSLVEKIVPSTSLSHQEKKGGHFYAFSAASFTVLAAIGWDGNRVVLRALTVTTSVQELLAKLKWQRNVGIGLAIAGGFMAVLFFQLRTIKEKVAKMINKPIKGK